MWVNWTVGAFHAQKLIGMKLKFILTIFAKNIFLLFANVRKCSIFWAHAFKIWKKFQYKSKLAKSKNLIILPIAIILSQNPIEIQKSVKLMHLTGHGAYLNHMCVEKSILCISFTFNSSIHLFMGHLMHHPKKICQSACIYPSKTCLWPCSWHKMPAQSHKTLKNKRFDRVITNCLFLTGQ